MAMNMIKHLDPACNRMYACTECIMLFKCTPVHLKQQQVTAAECTQPVCGDCQECPDNIKCAQPGNV